MHVLQTAAARTAAALGAVAMLHASPLHAQKPVPQLGGTWVLNTDLSDSPEKLREQRGGGMGMGGGMGRGGMGGMGGMGRGGMGGMGRGGMGGMGGGRGGMQGGPDGPGGSGGDGGRGMMALMRPAAQLTIVQDDSMLTQRDDRQAAVTFFPDGRPVHEYFESGEAKTVAKWKGDKLEVKREMPGGPTVELTYRIDPKTGRLELTTNLSGGRMPGSMEIKRVYDPAPPSQ